MEAKRLPSALIENAVLAAFDAGPYETGGELDQLCEIGCDLMKSAAETVDALQAHRKGFALLLKRISEADGDAGAKAAILTCWQAVVDQLEASCKELGR